MAAPVYTLPTSGTSPKYATKVSHETAINAALISLLSMTEVADAALGDRIDGVSADVSDLDARLATVASGNVPAGSWDASSGAFPSSSVVGTWYNVAVAGTVDGVSFAVNDRLYPLTDNASTSTFAANWDRVETSKLIYRVFDSVVDFVADTTATRGLDSVWEVVGGLQYRELDPSATSYHIIRGDGLKFNLLPTMGPDCLVYNLAGIPISSSADLQAFLDELPAGVKVVNPAGNTYTADDTVFIDKQVFLENEGLIDASDPIFADQAVFDVEADGCRFKNLRAVYSDGTLSTSSTRNYFLNIEASEVVVEGCHIEGFQHPIAVRAYGEFYNIQVLGNRLKDCIGNAQEDQSDGIIVWGAQAVIANNIVNAKDGHDCRVGIHVEALSASIVTPAPHNDAMITMTGNVVYGKFRRSMINEGCLSVTMSGNVLADATWQLIGVVEGAESTSVTGNTLIWTRTTADTQGSSYNPLRCPLFFYGTGKGNSAANNNIHHAAGSSAAACIGVEGTTDPRHQDGLIISDIIISAEDDTAEVTGGALHCRGYAPLGFKAANINAKINSALGVYISGNGVVDGVIVENSRFERITASVTSDEQGVDWRESGGRLDLRNVEVIGFYIGFDLTNVGNGEVVDCKARTCASTAYLFTNSTLERIQRNLADGCVHGLDLFGVTVDADITDNILKNASGDRIRNVATSLVPFVHGNSGQNLYGSVSWDPASIASGATASTNITVTGAAAGDFCTAVGRFDGAGSFIMEAHVTGTDTVTVTLYNRTGGAVDPGSSTTRATVKKYGAIA